MAISRFSKPINTPQPISLVDMNMLDSTLGYKQEGTNESVKLINNSIKQLNALDLVRPEDIAFRDSKLNAAIETLNGYGNVDLSNPQVGAMLDAEVQAVANDSQIKSMVQSTANYRKLNDRYAKLKENPKLMKYYSSVNEKHDMKNANRWLTGQDKTFNQNTPTLYYDVDGAFGSVMKGLAPKQFSQISGMHNIKNEIRSDNDLRIIAMGELDRNDQLKNQLMINAQELYGDRKPSDIYTEAAVTTRDEVKRAKDDIVKYQTQLTDTTLSKEYSNSISERIKELESVIPTYEQRAAKYEAQALNGNADPQELQALAYNLYASNYVANSTRPYIIDKQTITTDRAGMYLQQRQDTRENLLLTQQNANYWKQKDYELEVEKMKQSGQQFYDKLGATLDASGYDANGNLLPTRSTAVGSGFVPGRFGSVATVQPTAETDVVAEIATKTSQLALENRNMLKQSIIDIVGEKNPTLAGELDAFMKDGSKQFKDFKGNGASAAEVKLFENWDRQLYDAMHPERATVNPALSRYGDVSNKITFNVMKMQSMERLRDDATKEVYDQAVKDGYKQNIEVFKKEVNDEMNGNTRRKRYEQNARGTGEFSGLAVSQGIAERNDGAKWGKAINEKLRTSGRLNEFYTAVNIAPEDKRFNDAESTGSSGLFEEIKSGTGIVINGKNTSVNGMRGADKAYRDNIDNVTGVRVDRIVPNTNSVYVTVLGKKEADDKKPTELTTGIVQLNPDQMKTWFGRGSQDQIESIEPSLRKGSMVDSKGQPLYLNLNASVPDMPGNIKYRFHSARDGQRSLKMSILAPDANGRVGEQVVNSRIFQGEDAHIKATTWLRDTYLLTLENLKNTNTENKPLVELKKDALKIVLEKTR